MKKKEEKMKLKPVFKIEDTTKEAIMEVALPWEKKKKRNQTASIKIKARLK